jgi:ABC-type dipeptide/oligopeptide/nickel transport system permease component
MGKLTIDAINTRDRELFLSTTLVAGVLGLIGICWRTSSMRSRTRG